MPFEDKVVRVVYVPIPATYISKAKSNIFNSTHVGNNELLYRQSIVLS